MTPRLIHAVIATAALLAGSLSAAPVRGATLQSAEGPRALETITALPDLTKPHMPGRIIVGFEPSLSNAGRATVRATVGASNVRTLLGGARPAEIIALSSGTSVASAIKELWGKPGIRFVEPDYRVTSLVDPNDPLYSDAGLWGMRGPSSSTASPYGSRSDEAWAQGEIGSPSVYVGIIDEGIDVSHPDLVANIWTNPFDPANGRDDDGNGYVDDIHGWDFANDDNSVYDGGGNDSHGTHVAGTIGAVGGNGLGVAGVNWDVTMISAKFLGPSGGYISDAIDAVNYLTDLKRRHGINIVASSNSWGGGGFSQGLLDAVNAGGDEEILFVAAAGNSGTNNDSVPSYPSNLECTRPVAGGARGWDCVVAVAAIDANGSLASFSQYGATSVDLGAPGVNVLSTVPGADYEAYSGTSMATPHVSGAIALCAAQDASISAQELRSAITASATPTSSLSGKTVTGGRLNVASLIEMCSVAAAPIAGLPTSLSASSATRSTITLSWTDGVTNENQFEIQRAPRTGASCGTFATIGYAGRNATSYVNSGLSAETSYCYRVRGVSRYGGGSSTDWSATLTATTLPKPSPYSCSKVTYAWSEPTGGITLELGDDNAFSVDLPYAFKFFGAEYGSVIVSSNGILGFSSADSIATYENVGIPSVSAPNGIIAVLWDDLMQLGGATIRVETTGEAGSRTTAITWSGMRHYAERTNPSATVTFQALLSESDGRVRLNYQDVTFMDGSAAIDSARSATIGMEDESGDVSTRIAFGGNPLIPNSTAYECMPPQPPSSPTSVLAPSIIGDVAVGTTLKYEGGTFTGSPQPTVAPTWYRCIETAGGTPDTVPDGCTLIASRATYRVAVEDSGFALRVGVRATNSIGSAIRLSAARSVPLIAPVLRSAPALSGTARTGSNLSTSLGAWTVVGSEHAVQWYACTAQDRRTTSLPAGCTAIADATGTTFSVGPAQLGRYLRVRVIATNAAGSTATYSATSALVEAPAAAPTATRMPTISGTVRVGRALTAKAGSWTPSSGITYMYQWYRCSTSTTARVGAPGDGCVAIGAATTSTKYTVQSADVGHYLLALITATNSGGSSTAISATTSLVR